MFLHCWIGHVVTFFQLLKEYDGGGWGKMIDWKLDDVDCFDR